VDGICEVGSKGANRQAPAPGEGSEGEVRVEEELHRDAVHHLNSFQLLRRLHASSDPAHAHSGRPRYEVAAPSCGVAVSTESTPAADLLEARDHIGDEVAMHD